MFFVFTQLFCYLIASVFLGEQLSLLLRSPDQPENPKILKVAIIGAPNAGKSTLSNQLLGRKVSVLLLSGCRHAHYSVNVKKLCSL